MPTSFIKSVALTFLVIVQMQFTSTAFSYVEKVNLPIELALLTSVIMFLFGAMTYNSYIKKERQNKSINKLNKTSTR